MKSLIFSLAIGFFLLLGSINFQSTDNNEVFSIDNNKFLYQNSLACGSGGDDDEDDDKGKYHKA